MQPQCGFSQPEIQLVHSHVASLIKIAQHASVQITFALASNDIGCKTVVLEEEASEQASFHIFQRLSIVVQPRICIWLLIDLQQTVQCGLFACTCSPTHMQLSC